MAGLTVMPQTDVKSQVEELSVESFETFCEDIAGMFGIDMECTAQDVSLETSKALAKKYKKLAAVFTVQSSGGLDGDFHIVVDKEGLFTLSGTIVMLPEKRILDMRKKGTQKDAEELDDAVGETGNLLVGSWDRVFREGWESHGHFLQTGTFMGTPWSDSQSILGVEDEEEFMYVPFEMTVGDFPAFHCGVIFPESLFAEKPAPEAAPDETAEAVDAGEVPAETEVQADVPPADSPVSEQAETSEPETPTEEVQSDEPVEAEQPQTVDSDDSEPSQEDTEATAEQAVPTESPEAEVVAEPEPAQAVDAVSADTPVESKGAVSQSIEKMVNSFPSLPGGAVEPFLNVCAADVMQTSVQWADPDDSVQQALTKMQETDAGYLMVGTNGVLEGIVSWVDLIGAISIYLKPVFAKWRRPADDATLQIRLKVIMTRPVRTAKASTTLAVIMENMCQHGLRCLPIIDDQGSVQGMVTAFDVFKAMLNTDTEISTVGQSPQGGLV